MLKLHESLLANCEMRIGMTNGQLGLRSMCNVINEEGGKPAVGSSAAEETTSKTLTG